MCAYKITAFANCRGDQLVKAGEQIDFLGIIVSGAAFIDCDYKNMKNLQIGDTVGQMFFSDLTQRSTHPATVIASMDGLIAILLQNSLKAEVKRVPDAIFKLNQCVALQSMQTFYFNLYGQEHNQLVKHL
jgi:hypothetical protein